MSLGSPRRIDVQLTFVPAEFYTNPSGLYSQGISCLAKLKNGAPYPGSKISEKRKPRTSTWVFCPSCVKTKCACFPETRRADDFVSMTYNTNLDVDLNVRKRRKSTSKSKRAPPTATTHSWTTTDVASTPELRMTPLEEKPGFRRFIVFPKRSSKALMPEGLGILTLMAFPTKAGFEYEPGFHPMGRAFTTKPAFRCSIANNP